MNELKTERWNGHEIRFVNIEGEWMAVLKDVCSALELDVKNVSRSLGKEVCKTHPLETNGGVQKTLFTNEKGIFKAAFRSHKKEAEAFQDWVFDVLSQLRKSTGLEGFEVFRMLDKQHQKAAMQRLQTALQAPDKVAYIKANTIADKAVSTRYGHAKMLKKKDMTPQMLADRERLLDDTVSLMALNDRYHLGLSVSSAIYQNQ